MKEFKKTAALLAFLMLMSGCGAETKRTSGSSKTTEETTSALKTSEVTTTVTEPEPSIVIVESGIWSEEEAPVEVDWDKYNENNKKEEPICQRLSEDFISDFVPSEEYGAVFPFKATSVMLNHPDDDAYAGEYSGYRAESFGLCDKNGRIVCDPVYSEASVFTEYPVVLVATGKETDRRYGLLTGDGKKYTGIKYDHVNYSEYGIFARSGNKLTVFDEELNVTLETSFRATGYDADSFQIRKILNDSKCLYAPTDAAYAGSTMILDYKSGKSDMLHFVSYWYDDLSLFVASDIPEAYIWGEGEEPTVVTNDDYTEGFYLRDPNGKRLTEAYYNYIENPVCPMLCNPGTIDVFDPEGKVISQMDKLTETCKTIGNYFFMYTGTDEWSLYDKDINLIGKYKSDQLVSVYSWTFNEEDVFYYDGYMIYNYRSPATSCDPIIYDDGKLKDAITDEVIMDTEGRPGVVLVCGDLVAVDRYGDLTFSNGNKHKAAPDHTKYFRLVDQMTGKPYQVTQFNDGHFEVYDPSNDKTGSFELSIGEYYPQVKVVDDTLYISCDSRTSVFDISDASDPKVTFDYTAVDPMGDDY